MIKSSRQLKDLVKNMAKETGIESHILIRKYMMDRFLERISLSEYNSSFILKGGMLVSAFVGVESRATMDIDTTIKGLNVSIEDMTKIIKEISLINTDDNVQFEIKKVNEIMDEAEYAGIRFSMNANLDGANIPLKIDISTGDKITPREIEYNYKLMFEKRSIKIMTYPIETVLAEKLETVIARSITNTGMRDFYDIHLLLKSQSIDEDIFKRALFNTANKRGSLYILDNTKDVLDKVSKDKEMEKLWILYQKKFKYAKDYSWDEVILSTIKLASIGDLYVEKLSILEKIKKFEMIETNANHKKRKEKDRPRTITKS